MQPYISFWRAGTIRLLYVLDGVGYIGKRGRVEEIRPGDIVTIDPGEVHWHGATPTNFMAHIAINDVDENGSPASWGKHVTEAEYKTEATHVGL
ncbi:MAG TPA: AraC family ligand binding domain-containing protein [Galbitalea sp.]|nr:AraC family ligand binding domain-containing protein [Galbitalea sp.]